MSRLFDPDFKPANDKEMRLAAKKEIDDAIDLELEKQKRQILEQIMKANIPLNKIPEFLIKLKEDLRSEAYAKFREELQKNCKPKK